MLQTGELIIQRGNLNNGNLTGQTGSFTSGSLSGPATYVSVENDPVFRGSAAYTITQSDIDRWNQDAEASTYFVSYSYLYSYVGYALGDIDLSDYVTKEYLSNQGYITSIPSEYITQEELSANGYITSHQDLSAYVSKDYLSNQGYLTSIPSEYITEQELSECGYLTYHQSLEGLVNEDDLYAILSTYATKNYVDNAILNAEIGGEGTTVDLTYYLRKDELNSVLVSYATKADISNAGYVTNNTLENILLSYVKKSELANALNSYVSYSYLENKHYLTEHQSLADYPTYAYVTAKDEATYSYAQSVSNRLDLQAGIWNNAFNALEQNVVFKSDLNLMGYITMQDVSACGYLTQHQSLADYPTYTYTNSHYPTYTYLQQAINEALIGGDVDLNDYVTKAELSAQSYLTQHQDLSAYATKAYVAEYVATHGGGGSTPVDLSAYVTKDELSGLSYATQTYVMDKINEIEAVSYEVSYTISYTGNAYMISIWQGTYAQYTALPNHTTYQLYLIAQE